MLLFLYKIIEATFMKNDDNLTFDTFSKRNMSIALTFFLFVLAFLFTAGVDYFLLFKDSNFNYIIPKLFIAIIISTVVYIFVLRRFLSYLDNSEIEKKYDFLYSLAIILIWVIFIIFTFLMCVLSLMLLYVLGSLIYGIFSGQYQVIRF